MKDVNELTVSPLCLRFTPTVEQRWTESIMGKTRHLKRCSGVATVSKKPSPSKGRDETPPPPTPIATITPWMLALAGTCLSGIPQVLFIHYTMRPTEAMSVLNTYSFFCHYPLISMGGY